MADYFVGMLFPFRKKKSVAEPEEERLLSNTNVDNNLNYETLSLVIPIGPTEEWLRKRKLTTIAFCIENLLIGIEFSLTFLTLWLYLEDLVKPPSPKLVYGLVSSGYLLMSVICSFFMGPYVDHTRNIRKMFLIGNSVVIFGNFIYTLQFWTPFLFFGRFFGGIVSPLRSVAIAELSRVYNENEISSKISLVGMFYNLGFLVGPLINFAFRNVDFHVYKWHITYVNIAGLYVAIMFLLMLVISYFMVFDLSKQFDMKRLTQDDKIIRLPLSSHRNNQKNTNELIERQNLILNPSDKLSIFKKLLRNSDVRFILIAAFVSNYMMVAIDMWTPLLVVEVMHWSITEMNLMIAGTGLSSIVLMVIIILKKPADTPLYYCAILSALVYIMLQVVFMVLNTYNNIEWLSISMCSFFSIGYAFASLIEDVFLVSSLAKTVSSEIQTFTDTIRMSALRFGGLLALLISPLLFSNITGVGIFHIGIISLGGVYLIMSKETMSKPRLQVY